ncbi:redox-sensing transcriptional repressor Rex [bacterium]|nr:redox-sensing transcriptional repressor Rex [bacterium]
MNISVINRLTLYHFILEDYEGEFISSTVIANMLNIDNSQVRKDIKYIENSGKCRVGYDVQALKKSIEKTLGFKHQTGAFIIGAGNLGSALAKYDSFENYGLQIKAMFDNDPLKVGDIINGKEVYHISKLEEEMGKSDVRIAILTVPKSVAQDTAEFLEKAGIKYIWNFSPRVLKVSNDVKVWNENLIGSFLQFTRHSQEGINE